MLYNKNNNTITTERLLLRPYVLEDADDLTEMCNNYNLYKYTLNLPYPYSKDCAVKYINYLINSDEYVYAITDKNNGTLYGTISLSINKKHNNGELGYLINEKYWGKGIATEATKAIIDFGFDHLHLHKIIGKHIEENIASGKVMKKSGMFLEAILKDEIFKDNKYYNIVYYGIIKESK